MKNLFPLCGYFSVSGPLFVLVRNPRLRFCLFKIALLWTGLIGAPEFGTAAEIRKANNADPPDQGSSWIGLIAPGSGDVAVFDYAITNAGLMLNPGTNLDWAGIAIRDIQPPPPPSSVIEIVFYDSGFPPAGRILTLGAEGIDMSAAAHDLSLTASSPEGSHLVLAAPQVWTVGPQHTLRMWSTNDGPGSLTKAGPGTLRWDYSLGAPNGSHLDDSATLTVAGGTLELYDGTHQEIVGATVIAAGSSRIQQVNGTTTIVLSNLTRLPGGTLDIPPSGFAQTTSSNDSSAGGGILGGWATCGGQWAQVVAGGGLQDIVPFPTTGYSEDFLAANNVCISNSMTLSNGASINSLQFHPFFTPEPVLTFAPAGGAFGLTNLSGGIMAISPQAGILSLNAGRRLYGPPGGGDLIFHVYGYFTNRAAIGNNGGTSLIKAGGGMLVLDPPAANSYVGLTRINEGTLKTGTASVRHFGTNLFIDSGYNFSVPFIPQSPAMLLHGSADNVLLGVNITINGGVLQMDGQTDSCNTLVLSNNALVTGYSPNGSLTVTNRGSNAIFAISGTIDALVTNRGGLTKSNLGILVIKRDTVIHGPTRIFGGAIQATGNGIFTPTNSFVQLGTLSLGDGVNGAKLILGGNDTNQQGQSIVTVTNLILNGPSNSIAGGGNVGSGGLNLNFDYDTSFDSGILGGTGQFENNIWLIKSGTGILTLNGTASYAGITTVSNGTLKVGNTGALSSFSAVVEGGTLDLNNLNVSLANLESFGPAGVVANNAGGASILTITSHGSFSGTIANGFGTVSLVVTGANGFVLTGTNTYTGPTTIYGPFAMGSNAIIGNGTSDIILAGGGGLRILDRTAPITNPLKLTADSIISAYADGFTPTTANVDFSSSSISGTAGTLTLGISGYDASHRFEPRFSGAFAFDRPIVLTNFNLGVTRLNSFNITNTTQTYVGVISGSGSFRRSATVAGSGGTTVFNATNTYTGPTLVDDGTLLVNGGIGTSSVTVTNRGTLSGSGRIRGAVDVRSGGTLSPGASIGRMAISNSLTLGAGSTLFVELNQPTGTNDSIVGLTTVSYGGTLNVTNLGVALVPGQSFKLFSATNYLGAFANVSPATPGAGLAWDLSGLTNGILKIASAPRIENTILSGANLIISGSGGWTNGVYSVLSSTNLTLPINSWTVVGTNSFDGSGQFLFTNPLNPLAPLRFYLIRIP